jgi:DMSO/TMAO reductase YedYZ molybdopterin-dependent catalytic subunit
MRKAPLFLGALLGALTTLPLIGLFYLGEQFALLPFVPFDLFDWLARVLPGELIGLSIALIVRLITTLQLGATGETAKLIEQLMALGMVIAGGALWGGLIAWAQGRLEGGSSQIGTIAGVLAFMLVLLMELSLGFSGDAALSIIWLLVLFVGWGSFLGGWLRADRELPSRQVGKSRRMALRKIVGGSFALALGTWGVGRLLAAERASSGASRLLTDWASNNPKREKIPEIPTHTPSEERIEPVLGTRSELTSNDDFYRIDINTRPVIIQESEWQLEVDGFFENPRSLTLSELIAYPSVTQPVTMGCISNQVGGDLIGTSKWTGVRLKDVLEDLGLLPEAKALFVEAADGFFETLVWEDMMDERTLLVYGMNGVTLPVEHGFPLRIYIPNRYGMKQPKWITRIEALSEWQAGYWVVRGWNRDAHPQIVSVIDTIAMSETVDGVVPVGGIAWAGDRGIKKVEVQVDDGKWIEAELRTPPFSVLTWVQWRYDWLATAGNHTLRVRAWDGKGKHQLSRRQGVRPDGATGYHERSVRI